MEQFRRLKFSCGQCDPSRIDPVGLSAASGKGTLGTKTAILAPSPAAAAAAKPGRLLSLDLLRGVTIAFMILVNDAGDEAHSYHPLQHASWNGFTPTDLVFPTFLLLVGVSLVLSVQSRIARGITRGVILRQAARRTLILIALGLVVNSFPLFHLATLRGYGVLQRIGVCYFIATVLLLLDRGWRGKVVVALAALLGYWALMRFVPVPGFGVPTHAVPLLDHDGNLTAAIDRRLFSPAHLYEGTRDPEGLLSTLPAVGTILIGVLTGMWIRTGRTMLEKLRGILIVGSCLVTAGLIWNVWFPINKKLWTSSYVLFAAGLSLLLFAAAIWLVDLHKSDEPAAEIRRHPRPLLFFFVFGVNAIAAYVFSELLAATLGSIRIGPHRSLGQWLFGGVHAVIPDAAFASLVYALLYVGVCWAPIYLLYRKNIMLKV